MYIMWTFVNIYGLLKNMQFFNDSISEHLWIGDDMENYPIIMYEVFWTSEDYKMSYNCLSIIDLSSLLMYFNKHY
jgi:hypothetical protein